MKTIISFLILSALFYGCHRCKKDEYYYIQKDNMLTYKAGDILIFKSNQNILDTFLMENIDQSFLFNSWGGNCPSNGFYQELISYSFSNKLGNYNTAVIYSQRANSFSVSWVFNHFGDYYENELKDIPLITRVVNGKEYKQIYIFTKGDVEMTHDKISKLFFDKKYGVVRFEMLNGTIWELQ